MFSGYTVRYLMWNEAHRGQLKFQTKLNETLLQHTKYFDLQVPAMTFGLLKRTQ
jgi:hypothetical protein